MLIGGLVWGPMGDALGERPCINVVECATVTAIAVNKRSAARPDKSSV
jgi:hypothetical protein